MPANAKSGLYLAQQKAIFRAAKELGLSIDDLRECAADLNLGIRSLSCLSLQQRHSLIAHLIARGATARNPIITAYDREAEARASGKLKRFPSVTDQQRRLLDALAAQIDWREPDGYLRFCHRTLKAPAPRNGREVTALKLALQSLIDQQQQA